MSLFVTTTTVETLSFLISGYTSRYLRMYIDICIYGYVTNKKGKGGGILTPRRTLLTQVINPGLLAPLR